MKRISFLPWVALALAACAGSSAPGPSGVWAYRDALRRGDLDAAYALTSASFRETESKEAFLRRFATRGAREAKADAMEGALADLARAAPELGIPVSSDQGAPVDVLTRFLDATDRGDFRAAYGLLSARWRLRYTPDRFAADFSREPLAKERLTRARLAAAHPPIARGDDVLFPLGDGKAVVLHHEDEGYRVASLE